MLLIGVYKYENLFYKINCLLFNTFFGTDFVFFVQVVH
jgi:hypothetical protein